MSDASPQFNLYTEMTIRARATGMMPVRSHEVSQGYYRCLWDVAHGDIFGSPRDLLVFAHALIDGLDESNLAAHYLIEAALALETAAALMEKQS